VAGPDRSVGYPSPSRSRSPRSHGPIVSRQRDQSCLGQQRNSSQRSDGGFPNERGPGVPGSALQASVEPPSSKCGRDPMDNFRCPVRARVGCGVRGRGPAGCNGHAPSSCCRRMASVAALWRLAPQPLDRFRVGASRGARLYAARSSRGRQIQGVIRAPTNHRGIGGVSTAGWNPGGVARES
jgi:hypothetical protein